MVSTGYLLDTNVLSEPLRPIPDAGVLARLQAQRNALATAAPVWHELRHGMERLPACRRRLEIEAYLDEAVRGAVPILPYNEAAATWHAAERARLGKGGRTPPYVDGQIAAIARVNGLVLVTANMSDFVGFDGLVVEDWRS